MTVLLRLPTTGPTLKQPATAPPRSRASRCRMSATAWTLVRLRFCFLTRPRAASPTSLACRRQQRRPAPSLRWLVCDAMSKRRASTSLSRWRCSRSLHWSSLRRSENGWRRRCSRCGVPLKRLPRCARRWSSWVLARRAVALPGLAASRAFRREAHCVQSSRGVCRPAWVPTIRSDTRPARHPRRTLACRRLPTSFSGTRRRLDQCFILA
mmetsp:Transcript_12062/g.38301  ORF Transcript_12062/g.38301 Transcript_12062/m.38301 type:complete len:210 (+) Transcript_12062:2484-3113(+)